MEGGPSTVCRATDAVGVELLQVVGDAVQGPLAGAGSEPADHQPARALGFLHLAEDGLDGLATAAVEVPW